MKRKPTLPQRYFLTLFLALLSKGLQNLLSFFLTMSFFLCLLLVVQSDRIDKVARWGKAEPATRARMLEAWLVKSDIVERVSIEKVEKTNDANNHPNNSPNKTSNKIFWRVSNASFQLASGIEARFQTLTWEGAKAFSNIRRIFQNVRVEGLQVTVALPEQVRTKTTSQEDAAEKSGENRARAQKAWHRQVRQLGFLSSLAGTQTITLQDSLFLFQRASLPLLRLRFDNLVAENRNGLVWRGNGFAERFAEGVAEGVAEGAAEGAARAESRQPILLTGSYAAVSQRLYQSLRLENFSPQDMLRLIAPNTFAEEENSSEATRLWLAGKGKLSLDYRLDLIKSQSWLRVRFASSPNARDKNPTLSFDRSTDNRRTGLTNTTIAFRALPIGVVEQVSNSLLSDTLAGNAIPFHMSGSASGRLSLQQQQNAPSRLLGNLSLETPKLQWNKSDESATAHRLTLAIEGNDENLQISMNVDFDLTQERNQESRIETTITILPHEKGGAEEGATQTNSLLNSPPRSPPLRVQTRRAAKLHPSRFRLTLDGVSHGSVPWQTVRALWPPGFKLRVREKVVEVAKAGDMTELTIALDAFIDLKARKKKTRMASLTGEFLLQKGRLQLYAQPATLTDITAKAEFTKQEILFHVATAHYGDFRIEDGEVSFERQTFANGKKHTLMRVALFGEGQAEPLRRFLLSAPFLQPFGNLQRSARWMPKAPRATAKGHFNLISFLKQLNNKDDETVFPHPFSYDTAWQVEKIRLQAPFLRFYEGSATLASTSTVPLDLAVRMQSDRGENLEGRWRIALADAKTVRQQQEIQRLTLQGLLDAKALEQDFAYLPRAWVQTNLPITLSYRENAGADAKGLLAVDFPAARLNIESFETFRGAPAIITGSVSRSLKDPNWKMEGTVRRKGKTSLLIERGQGENTPPLALSLENVPKAAGDTEPAEWNVTLEGEDLDLSRWFEQKPWNTLLTNLKQGGENPSAPKPAWLGWRELVNVSFDARVKGLLLHKTPAPTPDSLPQASLPQARLFSDNFKQVRASLRWQDAKIHNASFLTHSDTFVRSPKKKRKREKRSTRTQAFYTLRQGKELFSARSDDLGTFLHHAFGKNFAEGGEAQLSLVRPHRAQQRPKPHFEGYTTVKNISLYEMPLLLKLFDAVNFVSAFRKGIRRLDIQSDLEMWDGILTLKEFRLANNITALSANGSLDLTQQKLDLRGEIASLHLVSKILRNIPLIGAIIVGGKRHNLFAFSYEAKGAWSEPNVTASPLNILLPGIIKIANPLQLLERDEIKKAKEQRREEIREEIAEEQQTPSTNADTTDADEQKP